MSTRETSAYCQPALLVAVMFIRSAFQMGVIKSVGVFLSNIQASLGESDTGIGVALGLFSACISSPAPLVGYFYGRLPSFSRRMMLIAGPLLSSLGLVLASLAVNYVQFSASLGISGVGFSFMLMCILLELSEQARTHFGLFLSIGSTGFAAGMSVIPLLGEFLMNVYGWRGAMLILGGLMGNLIPMIAAIRPKVPASSRNEAKKEETVPLCGDVSEETLINDNALCELDGRGSQGLFRVSSKRDPHTAAENEVLLERSDDTSGDQRRGRPSDVGDSWFDPANKLQPRNSNPVQTESTWTMVRNALRNSEFYRNPSLTLFLAAMAPFGMAYGAWHAFLIPRAIESGMTIYFAILVTVCVAVANITSRIVIALLTEKTSKLHEIHLCLTLLSALTVLCDVLIFRSAAIYVTSVLSSFTMAGRGLMVAIIIRHLVSPGSHSIALGFGEFQVGVGAFAGTYLSGFAADRFAGFNSSFMMVVGFEMALFLMYLQHLQQVPPLLVLSLDMPAH
ncbi:monocarboxylate transporter 5-like [Diadema antillarum]|uniref:monocarboxylate transporter 5-like n=1 Tax=Diadema antillarum TaxID=105358 RepID=UPI003A8C5A07